MSDVDEMIDEGQIIKDEATIEKLSNIAKKLLTEEKMSPPEVLTYLRQEYDVSDVILYSALQEASK